MFLNVHSRISLACPLLMACPRTVQNNLTNTHTPLTRFSHTLTHTPHAPPTLALHAHWPLGVFLFRKLRPHSSSSSQPHHFTPLNPQQHSDTHTHTSLHSTFQTPQTTLAHTAALPNRRPHPPHTPAHTLLAPLTRATVLCCSTFSPAFGWTPFVCCPSLAPLILLKKTARTHSTHTSTFFSTNKQTPVSSHCCLRRRHNATAALTTPPTYIHIHAHTGVRNTSSTCGYHTSNHLFLFHALITTTTVCTPAARRSTPPLPGHPRAKLHTSLPSCTYTHTTHARSPARRCRKHSRPRARARPHIASVRTAPSLPWLLTMIRTRRLHIIASKLSSSLKQPFLPACFAAQRRTTTLHKLWRHSSTSPCLSF